MTTATLSHQEKPALCNRLKDLTHYSELKRLVYNIVSQQQQKRFRSLAVLSAFPMEGKTLFCAAMAMAYVETCRTNVLVVDATTYHHPKSLILKDCLDPTLGQIEFLSLADERSKTNGFHPVPMDAHLTRQQNSFDTELVKENGTYVSFVKDSDHALIRKIAEVDGKPYGLVLLDTVSLMASNKNNIDPLLVAHLTDASVLIVSPKLLNSPDLRTTLKVIDNPALHLIGIVSNEEFAI